MAQPVDPVKQAEITAVLLLDKPQTYIDYFKKIKVPDSMMRIIVFLGCSNRVIQLTQTISLTNEQWASVEEYTAVWARDPLLLTMPVSFQEKYKILSDKLVERLIEVINAA